MDAFALDISGPWTAIVPRERGEMVRFNLIVDGGSTSQLTGSGSQHHAGRSWDFKIVDGSLQEDKVRIVLEFGPNDREEWVGELVGDEMKVSYSRLKWTSQMFVLKKGVGDETVPPSPQRSPARKPAPQQVARGRSGDSIASSFCVIS
jgi:hypothetical protein